MQRTVCNSRNSGRPHMPHLGVVVIWSVVNLCQNTDASKAWLTESQGLQP